MLLPALTLFSCVQPFDPAPSQSEASVTSLSATLQGDRVLLTWEPASGDFQYYRLYRTTKTDTAGIAYTDSMISTGSRRKIHGDSTRFLDILQPYQGTYYYSIRTLRVEDGDTIEGPFSPIDSCTVGTGVWFSINNGDLFASSPLCTLFVRNPQKKVQTVRFTQFTADSVDTGGAYKPIELNQSGRIEGDTYDQLRDLIKSGFLQQSMTGGARIKSVPDFDAQDAQNSAYTVPVTINDALAKIPWYLREGTGQKKVFAEFTYTDNSRDTILDLIRTTPHKVEMLFRNETGFGWNGATMRDTSEQARPGDLNTTVKVNIFYKPLIEFSVKIFGDTTLDLDFDYWLMSDARYYNFKRNDYAAGSEYLLLTRPKQGKLTGRGDLHNSEAIYPFLVDSTSPDMAEILEAKGTTPDTTYSTSSAENLAIFDNMFDGDIKKQGKKQFVLAVRLRDNQFNDSIVAVYGFEGTDEVVRTYRDMHLPMIKLNPKADNPDHIGDGDLIVRKFNFALDSLSVIDEGEARITDVELLIANLPDDYDVESGDLSNLRMDVFPYPIKTPSAELTNVRWDDIDPGTWSSGTYMMAVAVRDEFDNYGLAGLRTGGKNPWIVEVRTAR
jgi:hypothetical protein